MKSSKITLAVVATLVLATFCMTGCRKDPGYRKVTGTVTMDGQPLEGAMVMFYSQASDGEGGGGKTDAQGKYEATSSRASEGGTGLLPGEYKVTVIKNEEVIDEDQQAFDKGEITYDELQERRGKKGTYAKSKGGKMLTPQKFASMTNTPLSVTVTTDPTQNVFDFNLDE